MVTLDRLVNVLGGYGARLHCAAGSRGTELRSVSLHDPEESRPATGDVFLAVGAGSPTEAVRLAASADSAAVLMRASLPLDVTTRTEASELGIAVVTVDPSLSWSQLSSLVYGLLLEGEEADSNGGPTDLFAIADALAEALHGAVTIEDQLSRVLAYSSRQHSPDPARLETILGRRVPAEMRELFDRRGVFAHLRSSDEPVLVEPSEEHGLSGRVVIAIRAGRELLGSVWVESDTEPSGELRTALIDGARRATSHLLRMRARADRERQVESDLVIRLLDGTTDTMAVLSQLGLAREPFRVVAVHAHRDDEFHGAALLAFEAATTGFGWSRRGRSTLFGNTIYTVVPGAEDLARVHEWITELANSLPYGSGVCAGIGGQASAAELAVSRQEAEESLAVHEAHPVGSPVVVYDESWDEILLQRLRTAAAAARAPTRGPVVELKRHDAKHGTRYARTLHAWLAAQGDPQEAGTALGVHPNTVRYRLRRMDEVANLELHRPDKRVAMIIALAASADPW